MFWLFKLWGSDIKGFNFQGLKSWAFRVCGVSLAEDSMNVSWLRLSPSSSTVHWDCNTRYRNKESPESSQTFRM